MYRLARCFSSLLICSVLLLPVSCGSDSPVKGRPSIDFDGSDYSSVDMTSQHDSLPNQDGGEKDESVLDLDRDLGASDAVHVDAPVDTLHPDVPTSELPPTCEPGQKYCDGLDIKRCNPDGMGYTLVKSCIDESPCTDDYCEEGKCVRETPDLSCCFPECGIGQICMGSECICAAMCFGRECGDDGCGGTCGECPAHNICTESGQCSCIPQCEGLACGDDDCGGSCGACPVGNICEAGQCICIPNCEGKICGGDGCGGYCGECSPLEECVGNACTFTCPTCPEIGGCSLTLNPANYHAYYFCAGPSSWNDAKDHCANNAAYLVTVDSAEENAFLATLLTAGATAWIGLRQDWGNWKWTDGQEAAYTAWSPNQPDDGDFWTTEDCTETASWALWNDNECGNKQAFICELVPLQ